MRPAVVVTLVLTSLLAVTGAEDGRQESLSSARRIRSVATENAEGQEKKDEDSTGSGDDDEEGGGSGNDDADGKSEIEDKAGAAEVGFGEDLAMTAHSLKSARRRNHLPSIPPMDAETIISKAFTCNKKLLPLYEWCKRCMCLDGKWYCTAVWCYDWPYGPPLEPEISTPETDYPQTESVPEYEYTISEPEYSTPVTYIPTHESEYPTPEPEYSAPVNYIPTPEPEHPTTESEPQSLVSRPTTPWFSPPILSHPPWPGMSMPRPPNRYGRLGNNRTPGSFHQHGHLLTSRRPWPPRRPRQSTYPQSS